MQMLMFETSAVKTKVLSRGNVPARVEKRLSEQPMHGATTSRIVAASDSKRDAMDEEIDRWDGLD